MKVNKSVSFAGSVINPAISCKKGFNIISITNPSDGYTSYDLLFYLGSPDELTNQERGEEKGNSLLHNFLLH